MNKPGRYNHSFEGLFNFCRNIIGRVLRIRIPHAFGPPGSVSGFISQRYVSGSGSFYHQAKIVRKTLIPTAVTSLWLFIFKNDLNVPSKSKKQKSYKKHSFLLASWRSMTKKAGSGSTPKCHGSATLVCRVPCPWILSWEDGTRSWRSPAADSLSRHRRTQCFHLQLVVDLTSATVFRIRIQSGQWIRIQEGKNYPK